MEDTAVIVLLFVFLGPWPFVALWAGLRFRRDPSKVLTGGEALVRVVGAIILAFVLIVASSFGLYVWANVAGDHPLLALAGHFIAMVPAYWVTRYRLEVPFAGAKGTAARVLFFIWFAFWLPILAFLVYALIYESV